DYSVSGYTGITFWFKGTGASFRVLLQTLETESTTYGGLCTLPTLTCAGNEAPIVGLSGNDWMQLAVPFAALANGTAPFNPAHVATVEFQPTAPGPFDFWIDDISFY